MMIIIVIIKMMMMMIMVIIINKVKFKKNIDEHPKHLDRFQGKT